MPNQKMAKTKMEQNFLSYFTATLPNFLDFKATSEGLKINCCSEPLLLTNPNAVVRAFFTLRRSMR